MQRISLQPRNNWQKKCQTVGFHFYEIDGIYWNESACYQFTETQINELEIATEILQELCLEAVDFVIQENRFHQLCIPEKFAQLCRKSWEEDLPSIYGRFDLVYDGKSPPKLLEYNADTPTALLEASVVQWTWLEEVFPRADQFNSLHEKLLETFTQLPQKSLKTFYFSCAKESLEDLGTVEYLRDLAIQAGWKTEFIFIEDIGWNHDRQYFCDLNSEKISLMFKLYPWEWLIRENFGEFLLTESLKLIEPPWKMILSNKAILPILWELFPDHPNLLPSYYDHWNLLHPYVSKPIFSREGANITLYHQNNHQEKTDGIYADEPLIYQAYAPLPEFDGYYPVIGAWIINNQPAGIGIREDRSLITQNSSCFVPHYFI